MDELELIFNSLNRNPVEFLDKIESKRVATFTKKKRWAKSMRRRPTKCEAMIWDAIKGLRSKKIQLRNQYVLFGFIADFCCLKHKIVIEIDGPSHKGREQYDRMRDAALKQNGWRTIRFTNEQVENNLQSVVDAIRFRLGKGPIQKNNPHYTRNFIASNPNQK